MSTSNNIHSSKFNTSFSKFNSFTGINANLTPSSSRTIPEIINLEKTFLTNAANRSRPITTLATVSIDTDTSNIAKVYTMKCIYPNTPSPPQKSMTGYQINIIRNSNKDLKCLNKPPQNYSDEYYPDCLRYCSDTGLSQTPVKIYQCANIPPVNVPFFMPFGGWGDSTLSLDTNNIRDNMSSSDRSKILSYLGDFQSKEVKVRDASGQPIYTANKKSTTDLETWTKLEDLCQ
jgi:hypothetical protein